MITWIKKANNFRIAKVKSQGADLLLLDFCANFSMALLIKVFLIKKGVYVNCYKSFLAKYETVTMEIKRLHVYWLLKYLKQLIT